jgi:hypothetical protein
MKLGVGQVWGLYEPETWLRIRSINLLSYEGFDRESPEGLELQRSIVEYDGTVSWLHLDFFECTETKFLSMMEEQGKKLVGKVQTSASFKPRRTIEKEWREQNF